MKDLFGWKEGEPKIVSVVGSGVSLANLTDDNVAQINASRVLRANWFFQDEKTGISKDIYGWFYGIMEDQMLERFKVSGASCEHMMTPLKSVLKKDKKAFDVWGYLRNRDWLCSRHLRHIKYRGGRNLPTTGMVMLAFATVLEPDRILMAGIDFYDKAVNGRFTHFGRKDPHGNPLKGKKAHDIETEIRFLSGSCGRITEREKIEVLGNKKVSKMVDAVFLNMKRGMKASHAGLAAAKELKW